MRYQILGPVEVFRAGGPVRLGGPKQRAVLALLLLSANRVVAEQRFFSLVWAEDPPPSVRGQLQMYVSQLRKLIGEPVIIRRPSGYLIEVRPGELDLDAFDDRVRQARADLAAGRPEDAVAGFSAGLALWHGHALGGVTEQLLDSDGPALRERRLTVLEEYFDAALAVGEHDRLTRSPGQTTGERDRMVRDIRAAAEENPLRERLQAQLMLALHGVGRTAEALEVYTATRSRLVAERGVEPGPLLRDTQMRLLRDEDQPPPAPVAFTPRQLPADVAVFAGRTAELARLDGLLPGAQLIVIGGGAGVGKTALAVRWAHRIRNRFPDGQLYVNLRGFDPCRNKAAPDDAVRGLLEALGVPAAGIPADAQARYSLYRSLLADKRVLVVLDNARDAEQVRPLLPGAPGCLTVVTSRDQLPSLIAAEGAVPVMLGLLSQGEARDLLARRVGAARLEAEPDAVAEIVARCARLPLALAIVAARVVTHPAFSLTALTGELTAAAGLDAFDTGDPAANVRAVFSWSYLTLSEPAAELFRLLGLHPGPHVTPVAAASMVGVPVRQARVLLAELARAHLVVESSPGRHTSHDLLRAYASELAHTVDPEPVRHAALQRMLDHYVHTAYRTDRFLRPHQAIETVALPADVSVPDIPSETRAVSWFSSEYENIIVAVDVAARNGFDHHSWQLACVLTSTYWYGGARWLGGAAVYETGLDAARRLDHPGPVGFMHRARAVFRMAQSCLADAETDLVESLRLFEESGDLDLQGDVHLKLGWLRGRHGDYDAERQHAETALNLYRTTGNRIGQAMSYNNMAWTMSHLGEHEPAVILCKQALAIFEEVEDRKNEAATWDTLGYATEHLGQHDEAIRCYERAIELHRKADSKLSQAHTYERIGEVQLARGTTSAARAAWQQALDLLVDLRLPDSADRVRARLSDLVRAAS